MKKSLALTLALIMVLCMLPMTALASYTSPTESKYNLRQNAITFSVTLPNGSTVSDDIGRFLATDPITLGYQWGKDPCGTSNGWVLTINGIPVHAHWAGTGNIYRWVMTDKGVTGSTAVSRQAYILYYASGVPAFVEGKQNQPPTVNGNQITFPPQGPDEGSTATLQVNTVITGDQKLTSNGTPFPVTVGTGYIPDDYKTGLDNSNYTYTFVKAERNSGTGLFKPSASSSNVTTNTDNKFRQFFPASGANVVTVYYTAKTLMTPGKPSDNDIYGIVGDNAVKVHCTNDKSGHADETYALIAGSFTIGDVTKDNASGKYFCNITVHAGKYVDKYNNTYGSHTLDQNEGTAVIKLEYNNGKWEKVTQPPVVFNVKCNTEPAAPQKPSNNDIPDIVGSGAVKVECVTYGSGHGVETYELIAGSYDVGKVEGDATTGYTCKITVHAEEYVNKYNNKYTTTNHRLKKANESSKVITLKYENNAWTVLSGKSVTFEVECTPIHTDRPSDDTVKSLIGNVEVECSNKEEHTEKEYELISGSYSIGDVAENECVITIAATEYVKKYNDEIAGHRLADGESDSKTVTLKYEFGAWKLKNSGEVPVEFFVTCAPVDDPLKPEKPSDDDVKKLLGDVVTIDCTNSKVTHEDKTYGLLSGGFSVGDVQGDKEHGYTVNVTVTPDAYVTQYSNDIGEKHNLSPDGQDNLIITLKCAGKGSEWEFVPFTTKTYTVVCETGVTDKVTVSFDSNGGTAVAPQTINKGEKATRPANPTRDGYTFDNWYLDGKVYDFNKPVDKDITLLAQWKKNDDNPGQNPYPDPSPKPSPKPNPGGHDHGGSTVVVPITVYMPPKTGDMPFWYSIAQFLGLVK